MTKSKSLRFTLHLVFALLFLWLVIRQINLSDLRNALASASAEMVVAALGVFCCGYLFRIERWRIMLASQNSKIKWCQCAGPFLASFAANNTLPFRSGDVIRAFAFNQRLGVGPGALIATIFVERLLDMLMLLLFLSLGLFFFNLDFKGIAGISGAVLLLIACIILLTLFFPQWFCPLIIRFGNFTAHFTPKWGGRLQEEIKRGVDALKFLSQGQLVNKLILWSALSWIAEGVVFWLAAKAMPMIDLPTGGLLAMPLGTLATVIPSTPGYIGTFDYFTVFAMKSVGNSAAASVAFAFLVHALLWFPATTLGGIYLMLRPPQKSALKAAS